MQCISFFSKHVISSVAKYMPSGTAAGADKSFLSALQMTIKKIFFAAALRKIQVATKMLL
jgi:hypothetical protein